jgi:hypothetical protein
MCRAISIDGSFFLILCAKRQRYFSYLIALLLDFPIAGTTLKSDTVVNQATSHSHTYIITTGISGFSFLNSII